MKSEKARTCLDKRALLINGRTYVSYHDALACIALSEAELNEEIDKLRAGLGMAELHELEQQMAFQLEHVPDVWAAQADAYKAGARVCMVRLREHIIANAIVRGEQPDKE